MGKQILKGLSMLMVIVTIGMVSAVTSANAQSATRVVADVPFEFVVGAQTLPSGKYAVGAITAGAKGLMIRSASGKQGAIRLTNPIDPNRNNTQARLVFHRYGQRYFLSEVWMGGDSAGHQLLKSKQERALERELAAIPSKSELAQAGYETVEILATLQ